ncbi:hypothetical protein CKN81_04935 [Carnobacterium divergens]|nr:hypothetical protein CKN81_04935 [Carnobacterium divergens]
MVATSFVLGTFVLASCGTKEKEVKEPKESIIKSAPKKEKPKKKEMVKKEQSSKKESTGSVDFSKQIAEMKKETDAKSIEKIYASQEPIVKNQGEVVITLDGYEYMEIKDFNRDFAIPFEEQIERGGIMIAKYTIENKEDKEVYFTPSFDLNYVGTSKISMGIKSLLPDEKENLSSVMVASKFKITSGETKTGYLAYAFGPTAFDKIKEQASITLTIPGVHTKPDSFKSDDMIGSPEKIELPISSQGEEKKEANAIYYQDKVTVDNMGEKTMIKEKSNINKTETLEDVDVTIEGYQFTDFVPNEVEAPRFDNAENGFVLLTAKFQTENKSDKDIDLSMSSSVLRVNNGTQRLLSSSMLLATDRNNQVLEQGSKKEFIQVFLLDKEQYEKIWKEKDFTLEVNLRTKEGKTMGTGKELSFDLPK